MQLSEFNEYFLSELSTKLVKETKKDILLLGDFNIDLLKSDENSDSANFLDIMFSNSFMPHITSPTRISPRSKTLIDNIFSTDLSDNLIAGNIITSISDHLGQFLILSNRKLQKVTKTVIYQRSFAKMDKKSLLNDLRNLNWEIALSIAKKDVNHSFREFLNIIETLLDTFAPLSPLSKADQKKKLKPWITKGLLTSIKKKN